MTFKCFHYHIIYPSIYPFPQFHTGNQLTNNLPPSCELQYEEQIFRILFRSIVKIITLLFVLI